MSTNMQAAGVDLFTAENVLAALPSPVRNALSSPTFQVGVANKAGKGPLELLLYGVIGDRYEGYDAKAIVSLLTADKSREIVVRINSPGGLVFDGLTIHNALIRHAGAVNVVIEGIAASAASLVAVAGDHTQIVSNGHLMIHRCYGGALGNTKLMAEVAKELAKIDDAIAATLAAKSGSSLTEMLALLDGESDGTFMSAAEALEVGLVDEVLPIRGKADDEGGDDEGVEEPPEGEPAEDQTPVEPVAATTPAVENQVPSDPPGGGGEGVAGRWRRPTLKDFTDSAWSDLPGDQRTTVAKHFAWHTDLDGFASLLFPHHFPPNHRQKRKASITGVKAAIARVASDESLSDSARGKIRRHLRNHLPEEDSALQDEVLLAECRRAERVNLHDQEMELAVARFGKA